MVWATTPTTMPPHPLSSASRFDQLLHRVIAVLVVLTAANLHAEVLTGRVVGVTDGDTLRGE